MEYTNLKTQSSKLTITVQKVGGGCEPIWVIAELTAEE
jgi:hypothetical protein